jgi:putative heme-binding domain-containing protein
VGYSVGPDLNALADRSVEALVTAILDPNRAVEAKYTSYLALTRDGRTFQGLLAAETATSLELLAAQARRETLLRAELEDLTASGTSLMPEGLEKDLTPQDVGDVIAFIRSNLAPLARKTFAGNEPAVVSADANGCLVLPAGASEIFGSTLVFEPQYQNLGWWSSADDHAVWTTDVPAGRYSVSIEWACDAAAAGHTLILDGGEGRLQFDVPATDGWDDYRRVTIGQLTLGPSPQRLTARPAERPLPALMDLKSLTLVRIEE